MNPLEKSNIDQDKGWGLCYGKLGCILGYSTLVPYWSTGLIMVVLLLADGPQSHLPEVLPARVPWLSGLWTFEELGGVNKFSLPHLSLGLSNK